MRYSLQSLKGILAAALLAVLAAGCTTVQVSQAPKKTPDTPAEATQRVAHWQFDAGSRPPAERDGYRPPQKLAVLLPLSGSLATAAAPVRDGLLAGYYGEQRRRPELKFYDTAGTAGGAIAAYQKAVAEGADQVVGPLGRDEVDAVFRDVKSGVPVLALNYGTVAPPANNASYSLAPEDDGNSAADYLTARKAQRVLVLSSGDDYARRSAGTFAKRLQENGGSVMQTLAVVGDKPADMTATLQAALQREGGVDAVFLALRGPAARAVAPQLLAAGYAGKPLVATSQLASGTGKAEQDRALDGIAFPTERWGVASVSGLPGAADTGNRLATARGPAAKLFAFGYDAWLLTAYLEHLATSADANVQGATGALRIGATGNVLRTPAWSTFSSGYVVPLNDGRGG
nr:penicillin-binding protein activator [Luteimonas aquatica]